MNSLPPNLNDAALKTLEAYDFPGNVRQLKNIVEGALIESQGASIQPHHLRFPNATSSGTGLPSDAAATPQLPLYLDDLLVRTERNVVEQALIQTNRNAAAAARLLNTNRTRVYRSLNRTV